ncbi:hypothetical protein AA23498_2155 [Acetobacter nitrogenifigens DSM 23921 = NBRC 105050]|uniref:Uncharacterized protein n=1 Tax=Acetobacter nitrogenifigens DSM 23921 = NBRC 105050 TaxID=1120919 RepID=A0A511X6U5_9PROT|nr:hypothetical protein [Acetobacter nitrogenifigens]GBQ94952.1 hypothetical protein AA23498_2155 [Acetobacter nitrogenifigens DSM 23921 = NBRC 105050]GEN58659.1 hypothetical protein ANI02nite_05430 [Acetobacter nitrogenifigens DSM 23921 = NBRC 105050]
MAIETTVNYITDLVDADPADTDDVSEGAQHLRNIKTGIKGTFSAFTGEAVTATEAQINQLTNNTMSSTLKMGGYGITGLLPGSASGEAVTPDAESFEMLFDQDGLLRLGDAVTVLLTRRVSQRQALRT